MAQYKDFKYLESRVRVKTKPSRVFLEWIVHHRMRRLRHLSILAFQRNSRGHPAEQLVAADASVRWELVRDSLQVTGIQR